MDEIETHWRSEYLKRIPSKIQAGRALVHNRVRPPANNAMPGIDGFKAWVLHPIAPGPLDFGLLEPCECGWMPSLGLHYVFPTRPEVRMPSSVAFRCISEALSENLPDDAVIEAVQVSADQSRVTIWTSTPGAVIGRRGSVAQRINDSLKSSLGKQVLVFVAEVNDTPDSDVFGGIREPREPDPESPSGAAHLDHPAAGG